MSKLRGTRTRRRVPGPDLRESALAAYTSGLPAGEWVAPPPHVAGLITVATILHAATSEPAKSRREAMIAQAAEIARMSMQPDELAYGSTIDPVGVTGDMPAIRTLVQWVSTRFHAPPLLEHVYTSLRQLVQPGSLDEARLLSAILFVGFLWYDDAHIREIIRRVLLLGRSLRSDEVLAVGCCRAALFAFRRGNVPQMERFSARAVRHAERLGDRRIMACALMYEGMSAGMRGALPKSTERLWAAYRIDDHPLGRGSVLLNIAETLFRAGHYAESRSARIAILRRKPAMPALFVSLGGYAVCSAALGDAKGVRWAADQCETILAKLAVPPRVAAQALLGCSDACAQVGLDQRARSLYAQGSAIADANGFHDLRFHPEPSARPHRVERTPFAGEAEQALYSIAQMEPDAHPTDLVLVPA